VPLECGDRTPSVDAVENTDDPHDHGNEQTKNVGHTHDEEANSNVDEALDETVVEEGELGGDERHVELTEDHDDTESDSEAGKDEEGPAVVLVAEDAVAVEDVAPVHVKSEVVVGIAAAVVAIVGLAEVVLDNGKVVKSESHSSLGLSSGPQTTFEIGIEVRGSFKDCHRSVGVPLKADKLVRTSPERSTAEGLVLLE